MIIGALLVGAFFGTVSGLITLVLGYSVWGAFLTYSMVGTFGTLAVAVIFGLQGATNNRAKDGMSRDLSSLQRG